MQQKLAKKAFNLGERFIRDERGFTESSLVLIPTIILFLCVIQIASSVLARSAELNLIQGSVARGSLYGAGGMDSNLTRKPLPGGGSLVLRKSTKSSIAVTPLLVGGDSFETTGISVDENN